MLRRLLFLLLLLASPALAAPRGVRIGPAPPWVEPLGAPDGPQPDGSARYGLYELLYDRQERVADHARHQYVHRVQKLVSPGGIESASELQLEFEPSYERLTLHHVRLLRGGRTLDALRPSEIKVIQQESDINKRIFNGTLTAIIIIKDVRVGDVLDYAYSLEGQNPLFGERFLAGMPLALPMPVQRLRHRLLWPAGRPLHLRPHGAATEPVVREVPTGREYLWDLRAVAAVTAEDRLPGWHNALPWVQLSEYGSWGEVVSWALPLYPATPLSPEMERLVSQWKALPAPGDRLLAATRFVQSEVRYLGIEIGASSHRPHPPAQVLQQRYGDCKDKTLLLLTLLRALGIPSHPALVDTGERRGLDGWQPSPLGFNHVILQASLEGRIYWIDSTQTYQRGGLGHLDAPPFERALIVREGEDALTRIERAPPAGPTVEVRETFTVKAYDQPVALQVVTTYSRDEADEVRESLATTSLEEMAHHFLNYYAQKDPQVQQVRPPQVADDTGRNVVTVTEAYLLPDFWHERQRDLVPSLIRERLARPRITLRKMPFAVPHPIDVSQITEVALPEPWTIPPESIHIEQAGVRFEREASYHKDVVTLRYHYQTKTDVVQPADLPQYLKTLDAITDELSYTLTMRGDEERKRPGWSPGARELGGAGGVLVLLVGVPWIRRRVRRARLHRRYRHNEGESATEAIAVRDAEELGRRLGRLRCSCGRALSRREEAPDREMRLGERRLTVVAVRCTVCGVQRGIYFDMGAPSP